MEDWSDDYRNDTVLFCFEVKAAKIDCNNILKYLHVSSIQ